MLSVADSRSNFPDPLPQNLTFLVRVLGLPRSADAVEIRKAFANLAMTCHPDVNSDPSAAAKFLLVSEA